MEIKLLLKRSYVSPHVEFVSVHTESSCLLGASLPSVKDGGDAFAEDGRR